MDLEKPKNKEAILCEEHFINTHSRDVEGRYIVKMPLKDDPNCLGESRDIALKRLDALWIRLARDPHYLKLYRDFIHQYEQLGHMKEIVVEEDNSETSYYMPHHGVYRPEKSSTKLRVVFNASNPTSNGLSLNSLQYNGGLVQNDLFAIMISFREYPYAFTADVKMMYRMILVHESQQPLLRILWKENPKDPVKTYELKTVTYGTVSAPFLATRTLLQLSRDEEKCFPLAAPILRDNVYMDDLLCGASTLEEAKELKRQVTGMLEKGGMQLHKWYGSHPELASNVNDGYDFKNLTEIKTLGVSWKSQEDCFVFRVTVELKNSYTKRCVLSTIARLFDPLGLLGPVVAKAKMFMQSLWSLHIDWNDELPSEKAKEWHQFIEDFNSVSNICVSRCIVNPHATRIELHGFADASEKCYGAVIYCRSFSPDNTSTVKLVTSKSRVAPVKIVTIPRLELCAAVLLSKLINRVVRALHVSSPSTYLWSDSTIILAWIKKDPNLLKTFVANRVATIQQLTSVEQWHYISSAQNPADLVSRGLDPSSLHHSSLWWAGPPFLSSGDLPSSDLPSVSSIEDVQSELKTTEKVVSKETEHSKFSDCKNFIYLNANVNTFVHDLISLSNNYYRLIRVLSYICRFLNNCRSNFPKCFGILEVNEIDKAEEKLLKLVQEQDFEKEIKSLKVSGAVNNDSQVKNLFPFLDKNGILRVGGRLAHSDLEFDSKFPILLSKNHKLSYLLVEHFHRKNLHAAPQLLLYLIRQKFWIINGRNLCKKVVHSCIVCFKAKPLTLEQLMGDLPRDRVTPNYPFNVSGVDFCGPFFIKYRNQRKGILNKIYVCIFICFVTKAIHLEMVSDLTSEAFIATLKRFFARRGKVSKIYSDNAQTFIGANREIKRLLEIVINHDKTVAEYLISEGIEWKFIPPRSPNFGGLWEAGVKSFKYHLKRVVGKARLTYEEFLTITNQIEGILNSRPLSPLSSDIDDLKVLTPAHFLIGRPINAIVEPDVTSVDTNRLKLWQKVTKIVQVIWKRWHVTYLSHLQNRTKWQLSKNNVNIGDMVLLKEESLPSTKWAIGRIVNIYHGKDGKVRVCDIKTQTGVLKRAISKLCKLPICN